MPKLYWSILKRTFTSRHVFLLQMMRQCQLQIITGRSHHRTQKIATYPNAMTITSYSTWMLLIQLGPICQHCNHDKQVWQQGICRRMAVKPNASIVEGSYSRIFPTTHVFYISLDSISPKEHLINWSSLPSWICFMLWWRLSYLTLKNKCSLYILFILYFISLVF